MGPCAKTRVTATLTALDGTVVVGENLCRHPQAVCPRAPGEGYEKCSSVCDQLGHAEVVVLRKAGPWLARGAHVEVQGHSYACRECQEALFGAGVAGLRVSPNR